MIGQNLGNYKIIQKIGAGGQGTVYQSHRSETRRTVVVKVLPAELTVKKPPERFVNAKRGGLRRWTHPNICTILIWTRPTACTLSRCQYVEGRNVRQLVNGRRWSWRALWNRDSGGGPLAVCHARGIIHRDIKSGTSWLLMRARKDPGFWSG